MKKIQLLSLLVIAGILLAACGGPATPTAAPATKAPAPPTEAPAVEEPTEAPEAAPPELPDLGGREVTIAIENAYLPFNYVRLDTGEAEGWDYDFINEACRRLNCTPVWVEFGWDTMIASVSEGQFDMAADGITITEERAKIVDFSDGYVNIEQRLLVRIDEDRFEGPDDFAADPSLILAEQVGTTNYQAAVELVGEDRIQVFDDFGLVVQALIAGDVDGVILDETAGLGYLGANKDKLKLIGRSLSSDQLGFIFPKGSDLVEPFNQVIAQMIGDGSLQDINMKWFGPSFTMTYDEIDCGAYCEPDPLEGVDPTGQEVIYWHQFSRQVEEGLVGLIEEFNATNEWGIAVVPIAQGRYNEIRDKMNAGMASGELPDIVAGYQNDEAFYASVDALVDMNIYVNHPEWGLTEEEQADFYPGIFNQDVHSAYDGARLGFPPARSIEVIYYNYTWGQELGFDGPPTTPAEFEEQACAAAATRDDGLGGYIIATGASSFAAWVFAFGGDVQAADGSGYTYNTPAAVEFLTMMKRMFDNGCAWILAEGYPNPQLAAREAIMTQGSTSGIPYYYSDMEAAGSTDEWGAIAVPHTTDEPVMDMYGGSVMIPKTTPEKDLAAWLFIKWFTQPEQLVRWDQISNYFPVRASAAASAELDAYKAENAVWATALELLQYAHFEPQLISYNAVRGEVAETYNAILQGADIEEALAALDATAAELHAEISAP